MALVMMDEDDKNPIFHDFLGMNSGTEEDMERSNLVSERQGANNSEVFHFHGRKNAIPEAEASNAFSGRKRSSSSSYMSLIRDRMLSIGSDSLENSRLMKAFGKEVASERLGKLHDHEMPSSMQPPPRPTSSLLLHPPLNARPHSLKPRSMGHFSSCFGQSGAHIEKLSSSSTYKDVNAGATLITQAAADAGATLITQAAADAGATLITQAAADEGSRTGMKGSGVLKIINSSSSGAGERIATGALPYSRRPKALQFVELDSSNIPSQQNLASSSRQMTIFYGGQAHVFDDVHPNKADVIMALAGSNGGSWSTNYSELGLDPPTREAKEAPSRENELRNSRLPLSIPGVSDPGVIAQAGTRK